MKKATENVTMACLRVGNQSRYPPNIKHIKLSLYLTKLHDMRMSGEVEVKFYIFLTSAQEGS
jgi:hypothetical protein